jgi:hypothetical protein
LSVEVVNAPKSWRESDADLEPTLAREDLSPPVSVASVASIPKIPIPIDFAPWIAANPGIENEIEKQIEDEIANAQSEKESPPEAEDEQAIDRAPLLPGPVRMGFYWMASAAAVIATCALTSALTRGPGIPRSAHVFVPTPVYACMADIPGRPLAPAEVTAPTLKRDAASQAAAKRAPASVARHRPASALPAPVATANGIVRDAPF